MGIDLNEIFFEVHNGLPREGPGNFESTKRAFEAIKDLPNKPEILDLGCGPGKQTLDLTKLSDAIITAVDNHKPFLETLEKRIQQEKLRHRIKPELGDMFDLRYDENSFYVIWSEGAIYIMGFDNGLKNWKQFLKKKGYLAVSEISWLQENPPEELRKFWQEGYPEMQSIEGNLEIIKRNGYKIVEHFVIPESAWWDEYYHYVQKRVDTLKEKYKDNPKALSILAMEEEEMDLYRKYSDFYGYVFYILQKND